MQTEVQARAQEYMHRSRFSEALRYVADQEGRYEQASLTQVRSNILDSARDRWESQREKAQLAFGEFAQAVPRLTIVR